MPDQATAEVYENAVRDLEVSPIGQAYAVGRANFEKVMVKATLLKNLPAILAMNATGKKMTINESVVAMTAMPISLVAAIAASNGS